MKRSKTVEVTTVMLTVGLAVGACDSGIDDRTANNSYYNSQANNLPFNYNEEKKLRISCDKPEDFSLPECHDKKNYQASAAATTQTRTHSSFIFMPWMWGHSYGGGYSGYSRRNYGPSSAGAQSYASARSAITGQGLASTYRASTIPASSLSRMGSMGSTISARATTAGIARGGFGGTGRGFAAASVGHAGAVSGS